MYIFLKFLCKPFQYNLKLHNFGRKGWKIIQMKNCAINGKKASALSFGKEGYFNIIFDR